jgi:hypothetical protein
VWTFTLAPVFAIVGLTCGWRLWREMSDGRSRRCFQAGFAALAVALLCEVAEDRTIASGLQLRGVPLVAYTSWLEEAFELLGPLLLLLAVVPSRRRDGTVGVRAHGELAPAAVRFVGAGR